MKDFSIVKPFKKVPENTMTQSFKGVPLNNKGHKQTTTVERVHVARSQQSLTQNWRNQIAGGKKKRNNLVSNSLIEWFYELYVC